MDLKLNIKKIDAELKRIGQTWYGLSKTLGTSWQKVRYWRDKESQAGAGPIAKVLGFSDPKDLII